MQPPQRRLFNRLAAFAGSWTLEAAENVCGAAGIDPAEVLELLGTLVDQSLVVVEEESGRVRYRLLEPMRQYAAQKLEEWGESQLIRDLHRDWFLAQAERSPFELMDPEHVVWLGEEIDNMRAALRWSIQQGVVEPGLRLARAAGAYWYQRGFYSEGRAWLAELLALQLGDTQMARRHFRENLALAQASGDTSELAWSLEGLAGALLHTQPDHAVRLAAAASTLRETWGAGRFRGSASCSTGG